MNVIVAGVGIFGGGFFPLHVEQNQIDFRRKHFPTLFIYDFVQMQLFHALVIFLRNYS